MSNVTVSQITRLAACEFGVSRHWRSNPYPPRRPDLAELVSRYRSVSLYLVQRHTLVPVDKAARFLGFDVTADTDAILAGVQKRLAGGGELAVRVERIEQAIDDAHEQTCKRRRTGGGIEAVMVAAAESCGVPLIAMRSQRRPRSGPEAEARMAAVWVARKVLRCSWSVIAAALARNHTTAMVAMQRCEARMAEDPDFRELVQAIAAKASAGTVAEPEAPQAPTAAEHTGVAA